ncbi:MAG: hotdog fold thioesterase [Alphaproteobacteria bacterium]
MVDEALFLKEHAQGLGALLGITFTTARKDLVVGEMTLTPHHLHSGSVVHGGIIMALADETNAYGTILNLPPGHNTATIESKTNFLRTGSGPRLTAEARPIRIGRRTSVWRATISRGAGGPIAEVTQTQMVLEDETREAEAPPPAAAATNGGAERAGDTAAERRRQIFEGACAVITRKGFDNATIREIAAAAGMPVPTMYQYIKRKEDLLSLIYEYFMEDYIGALTATASGQQSPEARLAHAVRETIENFDRNHRFIKLMFQETRALDANSRARVYDLDARYIEVWKTLLAERTGTEPIDAELAANFIYFLCTIWPLRHWTIGKYGRERVTEAISAFVLDGLGQHAAPSAKEKR